MSVQVRGTRVHHRVVVASLRAHAGVWLPVREYRSYASANATVACIRRGRWSHRQESPYAAGEFEARTEPTEFGVRVLARYVGTGVTS